jgi:hypothetical protein
MDAVRELLKNIAQRRSPKDKDTGLPKRYVSGLDEEDKKKQAKAILKTTEVYKKTGKVVERPKLGQSKRSPHVVKFEKKFGFPITDLAKVRKEFPGVDVDTVLAKGRAAYASGSRPGQTPDSWAFARLASVLTGGKSLAVDKDLVSDMALKKILG